MTSVALHITPEDWDLYSTGTIFGKINFQFGDLHFPDGGWTDFVVPILSWWLETLSTLGSARDGSVAELHFMDGPFQILLRRAGDYYQCSLMENDHMEHEVQVSAQLLHEAVLGAARETVGFARAKQWSSDDIAELNRSLIRAA